MYKSKIITIVVPCFNEERQIIKVLNGIPEYIDQVIVIDDHSTDETNRIVKEYLCFDKRVHLIQHNRNLGTGAAVITGYKWAIRNSADIVIVMDGDGQMNPDNLPLMLDPLVNGRADYTKANRLASGNAYRVIPKLRYFGNSILSFLTKIASGYWHITDSQSGFSAIRVDMLKKLDLDKVYPRYGYPNDLLVKLNVQDARVMGIEQEPVYNVGESSNLNIFKAVFCISLLLCRLFFYRMKEKYIIRDFHPLVIFYYVGILLWLVSIPLLVRLLYIWIKFSHIPKVNFLSWMFAVILFIQFFVFGMWFDMQNNRNQ
ncbi:MAG: glycosyltransferase family 2 protein [Candidatus Cloacimonetes bacterium]|nr:glycosyltransferase family 2 protein [Candidatus Cloacimonadota bacterium]